jgi:hypothetical protein
MTPNGDQFEPAPPDEGTPTRRAVEPAQGNVQNTEPTIERDVQRDVQLNVDRLAQSNAPMAAETSERTALFQPPVLSEFNVRWTDIQAGFVDEPRRAVQQADALVSDVIQRIGESFTNERAQLERQWDRDGDVSTEDLRQALRRYRAFFSRLLTL